MDNPWNEIDLNDYECHMGQRHVFQLQTLGDIMKTQFYSYPAQSVMILGIAGGNGLQHIDQRVFNQVYGVDINERYLHACRERYPELGDILQTICADLTCGVEILPHADLLVANLFIEYVGCSCFQQVVISVKPSYVSCVIQIDNNADFVSHSPYMHTFDRLEKVFHHVEESELVAVMRQAGYGKRIKLEKQLPNQKKFVMIDFEALD